MLKLQRFSNKCTTSSTRATLNIYRKRILYPPLEQKHPVDEMYGSRGESVRPRATASRPVRARNNSNRYYLFNGRPRGRFSGERIIHCARGREEDRERKTERGLDSEACSFARAPMTILTRVFITREGTVFARHRGSHVN